MELEKKGKIGKDVTFYSSYQTDITKGRRDVQNLKSRREKNLKGRRKNEERKTNKCTKFELFSKFL